MVLGMSPPLALAATGADPAGDLLFRRADSTAAAWSALRHRCANMNSLIALGTGAAFLYSVYQTVRGGT